jgi:hypothetical protein
MKPSLNAFDISPSRQAAGAANHGQEAQIAMITCRSNALKPAHPHAATNL